MMWLLAGMLLIFFTKLTSLVNIVITLILMSGLLMMNLILSKSISILFSLLFITVYMGAMMIMIGYICAISPNIIKVDSSAIQLVKGCFLFYSIICMMYYDQKKFFLMTSFSDQTLTFLYEENFAIILVMMICMLLLLLLTSSLFLKSKGSLRSLNY